MNRETWLNQLAQKMAPRFEELGFPLPKYRVTVGFGGNGQRSSSAAEVWHSSVSEDGTFEILIMPDVVEVNYLANCLAHELIHTAVGFDQGHKGNFAKVALAIGLNRPMTATTPGPAFIEWVAPFLEELGPMPHAKLLFSRSESKPAPREDKPKAPRERPQAEEPEQEERPAIPRRAGESTRPPKQTTRLKKALCSQCGYTARVTTKWLDVGPPGCPMHGPMDVEAEQPDDDQE